MIVKDLIIELKKCNQDSEIYVFDDESRPYRIKSICVDKCGDGELSHISLEAVAIS